MQNIERGGFWQLFDDIVVTPPAGRGLSPEDAVLRRRVFEAARALARGDYGPARAVLAEH